MTASFRSFTILNKHQESKQITSFYLAPTDNKPLWTADPGQYLTIQIPTKTGPVLRCYSISGDVKDTRGYRISVKREAAPTGSVNVRDGIGSCWLHDQTRLGDLLEIAAPRGRFILEKDSARPVVLLSGGVGQTPLISMLHSLKRRSNKAWFIHACANSDAHAFRREVEDIALNSEQRIYTHFIYRQPTQQDRQNLTFDSQDVIDHQLIQRLLPLDDYDLYLCGPISFMRDMFQLFRSIGLPPERIAYEHFGDGQALDSLELNPVQSLTEVENKPDRYEVVFAESNCKTKWNEQTDTLLELAEQTGLSPEYSCRQGICGSCVCELREGQVEYSEEPQDPVPEGQVLLCCARPKSRVVLGI